MYCCIGSVLLLYKKSQFCFLRICGLSACHLLNESWKSDPVSPLHISVPIICHIVSYCNNSCPSSYLLSEKECSWFTAYCVSSRIPVSTPNKSLSYLRCPGIKSSRGPRVLSTLPPRAVLYFPCVEAHVHQLMFPSHSACWDSLVDASHYFWHVTAFYCQKRTFRPESRKKILKTCTFFT